MTNKNEKEKGLKEQIKAGELSPDEAIKIVEKSKIQSEKFINWAKTHGYKRFSEALKKVDKEDDLNYEMKPKKTKNKEK